MAEVRLSEINKVFDNGFVAVSHADLIIPSGEFVVFVGPSGCGKSTLLRIIAGLEEPTSGIVEIDGVIVNDQSPAKRNVAMVFQNYALYPHMTVRRNLEFSLRLKHVAKEKRSRMVEETAAMLGLTDLLERRPAQLSGGQRQRVAMGRALVRNPSVFLLDEPLSNLDAKLRAVMRTEIRELQRRLGSTMVFVTHDQVEAMTMADRIAIIRGGVIQQVGPPQEIYDRPANLFVADFIGSPAINLIGGKIEVSHSQISLSYGGRQPWRLLSNVSNDVVNSLTADRDIIVGVRPEDLQLITAIDDDDARVLPGVVVVVEPLGGETLIHIELPAPKVTSAELQEIAKEMDEEGLEDIVATPNSRFIVKVPSSQSPRVGDAVSLRPRPGSAVHFFDPSIAGCPTVTAVDRQSSTNTV